MSESDVRLWLEQVLINEAGFTPEESRQAAVNCSTWRGSFAFVGAINAAIGVRATPRLPGGKSWWSGVGHWAKDYLMAGEPDAATYRIAEMLAVPAPDAWDPNWPEYKRFTMPLPKGAAVGDEFVVGNGEGQRGRFRVEEREGRLGAVLVSSQWSLSDLWDVVEREAMEVLKA